MYLLKLSLRPWRLAPFSQVFSALAVGILLFIAGLLFWVQQGLTPVIQRMQQEEIITAYIDPAVEAGQEGKVVDEIKLSLGAHADTEIKLVDSAGFIQSLKGHYAELSRELEGLGPEMTPMIPRYVTVAGLLPEASAEKIKGLPGVESVETSRDRFKQIVGGFQAVRWMARLLALALCAALVTGLVHLARINGYLHQDALAILKQWGAASWTVRVPAVLSSVVVGLLGGLLAVGAWIYGGTSLVQHIQALSPVLRAMPAASTQTTAAMMVAGLLIGFVSGVSVVPASRGGRR